MGFNKDTQTIFEKYVQNILEVATEEIVDRPEEELSPEDQEIVNKIMRDRGYSENRARLVLKRGKEVTQQSSDMKAQGIPSGSTVYSTPQGSQSSVSTTPVPDVGRQGASKIVGRADPSTAQGQAAIAQNQQNIANKQQQQASTQAAQAEKDKKSLQTMQTQGSKTFNAATNQTQNQPSTNNSGNTASSSQSQKSIDDGKFFDQIAANAGQGASASVPTPQELNKSSEKDSDQIESLKKELEELRKLMSKASDQDDEDIQEKINIKNFVRSFTRKNHSQANKYLNNLLWDKV